MDGLMDGLREPRHFSRLRREGCTSAHGLARCPRVDVPISHRPPSWNPAWGFPNGWHGAPCRGGVEELIHPCTRTCSLTWPLAVRRMLMVSCAPPNGLSSSSLQTRLRGLVCTPLAGGTQLLLKQNNRVEIHKYFEAHRRAFRTMERAGGGRGRGLLGLSTI